MGTKGYDVFMPDPGTVESMNCKVCGDAMKVTRNANSPTSFAGAMAKISRLHDRFECENSNKEWHDQIISIMQEMEATRSPTLVRLLQIDVKTILAKREVIK